MSPFLSPPFIISILIAVSIHEWAHGFVAHRLGDPTAEHEGRLTLNPLSHLDPMGTIMFLVIGFGWAKPVPVNPTYFKKPKRDMALVAIAGPVSNLLLAWIAFFILSMIDGGISSSAMDLLRTSGGNPLLGVLEGVCRSSIFINLALMAFNLLPIAPLDGSKVLHLFIPLRHEDHYFAFMQRGPYILLFLILAGIIFNVPLLSTWVFGIMTPVLQLMGTVSGMVL